MFVIREILYAHLVVLRVYVRQFVQVLLHRVGGYKIQYIALTLVLDGVYCPLTNSGRFISLILSAGGQEQ